MFQFKRDFQQVFCGARNPDVARLLALVLQHDLGLAPDHRALRRARGALAALECVHRAVAPTLTSTGNP